MKHYERGNCYAKEGHDSGLAWDATFFCFFLLFFFKFTFYLFTVLCFLGFFFSKLLNSI